jgi:hypothetical protein
MKIATKQSYVEVNQTEMGQARSNHWLRLLGDRNQVNVSAGFGRNGHSMELQALASHQALLEYSPDHWLRLLGGTGQTNHATNNGRVANVAPAILGNQQFTPEQWLRLLGASS